MSALIGRKYHRHRDKKNPKWSWEFLKIMLLMKDIFVVVLSCQLLFNSNLCVSPPCIIHRLILFSVQVLLLWRIRYLILFWKLLTQQPTVPFQSKLSVWGKLSLVPWSFQNAQTLARLLLWSLFLLINRTVLFSTLSEYVLELTVSRTSPRGFTVLFSFPFIYHDSIALPIGRIILFQLR